ncbi:hypothetical protein BGX27_004618, partial [Mortierella sp. AM989]
YWDLGRILAPVDINFPSTLLQYRGNCAEDYHCQPLTAPTSGSFTSGSFYTSGELPGTCQPLKAENESCQSSVQCRGWHIHPDQTYDNDQFRCLPQANNANASVCTNMHVGKGIVMSDDVGDHIQKSATTYLLSTLLLFFLAALFFWIRRKKQRQRQISQEYYYGDDNTNVYLQQGGRGGVYRPS